MGILPQKGRLICQAKSCLLPNQGVALSLYKKLPPTGSLLEFADSVLGCMVGHCIDEALSIFYMEHNVILGLE